MSVGQSARGDMWELLHAALSLQQRAAWLVSDGKVGDAGLYEREALVLLGDAQHLLRPDEPAQSLIRMLTVSGLTRLNDHMESGAGQSAKFANRGFRNRSDDGRRRTLRPFALRP